MAIGFAWFLVMMTCRNNRGLITFDNPYARIKDCIVEFNHLFSGGSGVEVLHLMGIGKKACGFGIHMTLVEHIKIE